MKQSIIGITLAAGLLATAFSTGTLAATSVQTPVQGLNQQQIQDSAQPYGESARAILFRGRERATSLFQQGTPGTHTAQTVQSSYQTGIAGSNGNLSGGE